MTENKFRKDVVEVIFGEEMEESQMQERRQWSDTPKEERRERSKITEEEKKWHAISISQEESVMQEEVRECSIDVSSKWKIKELYISRGG